MRKIQELLPKKPAIFYGWVIVAASGVMLMMLAGIVYSFGIFFKRLITEFGWSRTAISGVMTTYWACHVIFAIPIGWLTDRYGPRRLLIICNLLATTGLILISRIASLWQIYLFYGVMVGSGFAGTFAVLSATTARWFMWRRGLALGILACGVGLGTMVMAPFVERFIVWFSWRGAYAALGIMAFVTMVLPSLLIYKDPSALGLLPYGQTAQTSRSSRNSAIFLDRQAEDEGLSIYDVTHSMAFWVIMTIFMLFFVCMQMTMTHLYNYATDIGISSTLAASFISIAGGCSIIGRLGIGTISDHFGPRSAMILCFLLIMASFGFVVFARTVWVFYLFAIVFGLAYGGEIPLIPGITSHFFGLKVLGFIVGAVMAAGGFGGAIGPLMGGIIFDYTNSYALAFALSAVLSLAAVLLTLLLRPLVKFKKP